jgi:Rha family phage regulatory protein
MNIDHSPAVYVQNNTAISSSYEVAAYLGLRHDSVVNCIEDIICMNLDDASLYFREAVDEERVYEITKDGFTILALLMVTPSNFERSIQYVEAFREAEATICKSAVESMTYRQLALALAQKALEEDLFEDDAEDAFGLSGTGFPVEYSDDFTCRDYSYDLDKNTDF